MKEIGLKLKQKREENGISVEEAAADLKVRTEILESVEEGKKEDFQDIFSLKYFLRDYAKYLGLDEETMLDEFNDYLFEQTSKISLSDIEKAKKEKQEKEKNLKILSPYTKISKNKKIIYITIISIVVTLLIVLLFFILINK